MTMFDDLFKPMPPRMEPEKFPRYNPILDRIRWPPVIQSPMAFVNLDCIDDGIRIQTSSFLTERKQILFPKSKRKRIRKKFARNPANWQEVPSDKVLLIGRTYYIHPTTLQKFKAELAEAIWARGENRQHVNNGK